ncbi:hypothetical protein RintRC_6906 [Richelia intracellularis]|nr:hypothetical protein RintRC_6906 [Richelia intracellularis]
MAVKGNTTRRVAAVSTEVELTKLPLSINFSSYRFILP